MELTSLAKRTPLHPRLIGFLVATCGFLVFSVNLFRADLSSWRQFSILAVLLFISRLMPIRLPQGAYYSISFIIDLILIGWYGTPVAVVLSGAVTFIVGLFGRLFGHKNSVPRTLLLTGRTVLVIALAGASYRYIANPLISFALAVTVYFVMTTLNIALDSVTGRKEPFSYRWLSAVKTIFVNFFTLSLLTYILIHLMKNATFEMQLFVILLFFIPAIFLSHAFRLSLEIKQSYLNTVKTVARAIEAKDPYTRGHSERVAELTLAMARELRFPDKEMKKLEFIALLHDVGKIGVPEDILNKSGSLTAEELELVKRHPVLGAEIISKIKFLSDKADIVLYHHEKYDGSGYPECLAGEEIPIESRIIAIVDTYDALTTDRSLWKAKTPAQALDEMQRLAGSHFDPKLLEIFRILLRRRDKI